MRGIQSKRLMKMTREERAGEQGVTERELVQKKSGSFVNSPWTIRAMYQQLKRAWKAARSFAGEVKAKAQRVREPSKVRVEKRADADPVAVIRKPLDHILKFYPPAQNERGEWVADPRYLKAVRAANRGDGLTVKRMAAACA